MQLSHVPPSYDEFFLINPTVPQDDLLSACQDLLKLRKEIELHSRLWTSTELYKDSQKLKNVLQNLDSCSQLDDQAKSKMIATLRKVFNVLEAFKSNESLMKQQTDLRAAIVSRQEGILFHFQHLGIGRGISQLESLVKIGLEVPLYLPDRLLDVTDHQTLTLIPFDKARSHQQKAVYEVVDLIVSHLKQQGIIRHFSVPQLMQMKMGISSLMVNYCIHQHLCLEYSAEIFTLLTTTNSLLSGILGERELREFDKLQHSEDLNMNFFIADAISSQLYEPEFWCEAKHCQEVEYSMDFLQSYFKFIEEPETVQIDNLTLLKKNEQAGIALYELHEADKEATKTLVIFSYKKDHAVDYWNCFQELNEWEFDVGGLVHQPVFRHIKPCWIALEDLIDNSHYVDGNCNLITVGFGIDGAIAQALAYMWASDHPNTQTRTYMLNTAPFLCVNAAPTLRRKENHYAICWQWQHDPKLSQSFLGQLIQKPYSMKNCRTYTLPNLKGQSIELSNYIIKLRQHMQQVKEMYNLYLELRHINKILALLPRKDVPKNLFSLFHS